MGCCCVKGNGDRPTNGVHNERIRDHDKRKSVYEHKLEREDNVDLESADEEMRTGTPTILGGELDLTGLYRIPQSKHTLSVAGEGRVGLPEYANLGVVKRLDASRNKIRSLKTNDLRKWEALTTINLAQNNFHDVPGALKCLRNLTSLNISSNPLKKMHQGAPTEPCGVVSHLNLTTLIIQDCRLTEIPRGIARSATITDLDMGSNHTVRLSRGDCGISTMPKLKTIQLSYCHYQDVPVDLIGAASLTKVNLTGNPLKEFNALTMMPNLEVLILDNCMLRAIPRGVHNLTKLTTLSLEANPIATYRHLQDMTGLTSLNLSNCKLDYLPEPILECPLAVLDLVNNSLETTAMDALKGSLLSESLTGLNITGNPIAVNIGYKSFDVIGSELLNLVSFSFIKWGDKERSPEEKAVIYSNKIPAQLCNLNLKILNGVRVKEGVFNGWSIGERMRNVIRDGGLVLDLGVEWEEEMLYHVNLLKLFRSSVVDLIREPKITLKRYKFYLKTVMSTPEHVTETGEEAIIPPLDVLFALYIHVTNPTLYHRDMKANDLRTIYHLPYPYKPGDREWGAALVCDANDVFREGSVYRESALTWNAKLVGDEPDQELKYEWFVSGVGNKGERQHGVPGSTAPWNSLKLELNYLEEVEGAVVYVKESASKSSGLVENWMNARDRYLKYLILHILEPDANLVPSISIQLAAHVHQCIPVQYEHDISYYCSSNPPPLGLPEGGKDSLHSAFTMTSSLWGTHFAEEYMTLVDAQHDYGIMAHSPRREPYPHSQFERRSSLKKASDDKPHDQQARVTFLTGATTSNLVLL